MLPTSVLFRKTRSPMILVVITVVHVGFDELLVAAQARRFKRDALIVSVGRFEAVVSLIADDAPDHTRQRTPMSG